MILKAPSNPTHPTIQGENQPLIQQWVSPLVWMHFGGHDGPCCQTQQGWKKESCWVCSCCAFRIPWIVLLLPTATAAEQQHRSMVEHEPNSNPWAVPIFWAALKNKFLMKNNFHFLLYNLELAGTRQKNPDQISEVRTSCWALLRAAAPFPASSQSCQQLSWMTCSPSSLSTWSW